MTIFYTTKLFTFFVHIYIVFLEYLFISEEINGSKFSSKFHFLLLTFVYHIPDFS